MRAVVLACAIVSLALFVVAAWLYPGGNHFNHHALGHDFWRNAICDVARATAVGGLPNQGATFARASMTIMAVGIGALYWLLPERFPSRARAAVLVRGLGALSVPGAIAVVLLPSDRYSSLHGVAIVIAGVPGLTAGLIATAALVRTRLEVVTMLAVATFVVAGADFAIYVDELVTGGGPRLAVTVLERLAALLLLGLMVASSRRARV